MALSTSTAKRVACHSCQQWMLHSFIASIGGPSVTPTLSSQSRAFSRASSRWNEARERIQQAEKEEEHYLNNVNIEYTPLRSQEAAEVSQTQHEPELESDAGPPQSGEHMPWYLQVEPQTQSQENAISAKQRIPSLPEHPPAILQPLLERISVELGMDDLSLLDLREIDPPPALGANLIMIIGTARSEKHLHFSADKLCRWLRTEYKLAPYADGLLGRQELKLKMRRRAKRSRLLSAVGAKSTADTELEEGIRTGWICVNLGQVEGGELPKTQQQLEQEKNIVGFGTATAGSNIVVQLLTEEKRGEMDLEKLWATILRLSRREKQALEQSTEGLDAGAIALSGSISTNEQQSPEHANAQGSRYQTPITNSPRSQQARAFHTSSRRLHATQVDKPPGSTKSTSKVQHVKGVLPNDIADSGVPTLDALLKTIQQMPQQAALEALGEDFPTLSAAVRDYTSSAFSEADLTSSTPFVNAFHDAMSPFPGPEHWHAHVQLLCLANRIGHPSCGRTKLISALEHMQIAGLVPLEKTYMIVLVALLHSIPAGDGYNVRVKDVFDLLEEMECHGYNVLGPEILEMLHHAFVGPKSTSTPTTVQSLVPALGLARLKRQLSTNNIDGFWRTWRSYPQRLMPRPADMYVILFDAIAENKLLLSFPEAREVILRYLVDMEREQPPVILEQEDVELSMSIFKAVRYADPESINRSWDKIRERCEKVLRAGLQR